MFYFLYNLSFLLLVGVCIYVGGFMDIKSLKSLLQCYIEDEEEETEMTTTTKKIYIQFMILIDGT